MNRRDFLKSLSALVAAATARLPEAEAVTETEAVADGGHVHALDWKLPVITATTSEEFNTQLSSTLYRIGS
jgi:hypothetical protein